MARAYDGYERRTMFELLLELRKAGHDTIALDTVDTMYERYEATIKDLQDRLSAAESTLLDVADVATRAAQATRG